MSRQFVVDQRSAHLPAAGAEARLPQSITREGVRVHIDRTRARPGNAGSGARRFPAGWEVGRRRGRGYVELAPLSASETLVEVALPARAARGHAEALRDRLEGRPPRAPEPAAGRPALRLVAAGTALAIVAAAVPVFAAWTRPQAVSVDLATEQYRARAGAAVERPERVALPEPAPARHAGTGSDPQASGEGTQGSAPAPAAPVAPAPEAVQTPAPSHVPQPGVYRYDTSGWEELSMPGSRRSFPPETAATVTHSGCGFDTRRQPLEERWDAQQLCRHDDAYVLAGVSTYRSFFGRAHDQDFTCRPTDSDPGAWWAVHCQDGDTTMAVTARLAGAEQVMVAGQAVETVRFRVTSRLDGDTTGVRTAELWTAASGLLLRTEVSADLQVQGPFGPVRYREEHTLHLADLDPRQ